MASLTPGEIPRKMAKLTRSVIDVNIRSRNSKSAMKTSLFRCMKRKENESIRKVENSDSVVKYSDEYVNHVGKVRSFWYIH